MTRSDADPPAALARSDASPWAAGRLPGSRAVARLRAAGCVFAEDEAGLLEEAAGGDDAALDALLARRVAGEPLELIVGWAQFRGRRVSVGPGVFVPRARTEFLVDCALRALAADPGPAGRARTAPGPRPDRSPVVVDLCCGCGAVATAIAAERPGIRLHAADISPAATACARNNLAGTGALVHIGDLFEALPATLSGQVDLLVANAPYVPSDQIPFMPREARDHEPLEALDGGPTGVEVHARIAAGAPWWLATGGTLLIESSPALAERTSGVLAEAGLQVRILLSVEHDAVVVAGRMVAPHRWRLRNGRAWNPAEPPLAQGDGYVSRPR